MSIYKKTLIALEQQATPNSKQNKFKKLEIETEDEVLRGILNKLSRVYSLHIKPRYSRTVRDDLRGEIPVNHREWITMKDEVSQQLREYLIHVITQQIPEWQIQAERHGWKPPTS